LANSIIGRFSNHNAVADCVRDLLGIGIRKDDISLMTHHDVENKMIPDSIGVFQKNGDISSEGGGMVVGGVLGTLIGSLMGVATLIIPQFGIVVGAGPLMAALCGGILGGVVGDEIAKTVDAPYSDTSHFHPYVEALKEGSILCGVETDAENRDEISKIMSKYATSMVSRQDS
jgi:hypothetical protein